MKNKLTDLTDHLFLAMEAVNSEGQTPEDLAAAITRAQGVVSVARVIIDVGRLAIEAQRCTAEGDLRLRAPALLGLDRLDDRLP